MGHHVETFSVELVPCDGVDFVCGTDKDEGGDEQVEHRVVRHQDQDPCGGKGRGKSE